MSAFKIFDIAGSGMNAQNLRLNLVASNISNANSVSSSIEQTYKLPTLPIALVSLRTALS